MRAAAVKKTAPKRSFRAEKSAVPPEFRTDTAARHFNASDAG